ncbi:Nn.00g010450.m01.CDS01 [Neocucurbitaria sp. VM-36]
MNPDTTSPLCPDWVFLNNANVHVAKDRGWFKTYTPFTSTVDASPFVSPHKHIPVLGIGTVEIPTKRSPNTSGVSSHGSLLLREVLYVPDCLCNIIGQPLMFTDGYNATLEFSTKSRGTIKDRQGKNVAYFDPKSPLFAIKARCPPNGPTLGPHALKKDGLYEFEATNELFTSGQNAASYTAEETAFLKKNYGSEFHFLIQHGLKIHVQEDREEGRAILRAVMREGEMSEEEESDDREDDFDESEFEGHQADYNFTNRQLDWIEKNYHNSEHFMISYGLKFYDDEDLQEAKVIVEAMMYGSD